MDLPYKKICTCKPLFLPSNSTFNILRQADQLRNLQYSEFPYCCADLSKESGRKGCNVYKLNQLLLPVAETEEWRITETEELWIADTLGVAMTI